MNELKIKMEIRYKDELTIINSDDFDRAIISLINEREWFNYYNREKLERKMKYEQKKEILK